LERSHQFLFLASGSKNGEGFWFIGVKNNDENVLDDEFLLECYRKELIGSDSAKNILFAINLNTDNIIDNLAKEKYSLNKPSIGISFDIPLNVLENIFDFWLDKYKCKADWEICLGLLKTKKRLPLSNLIRIGSLKGNSMKWAKEIEKLHGYKPNSKKNNPSNDPMWR
tara:strand:+ start:247 stop:750 length:504 start_codon:yes stop_codon:yes gene_type:complete